MSDFVKKVQVDGETKPISLGQEAIGSGLELDPYGRIKLNISSNVSEHSGLYIDNYGYPHIAVDKDCGEWLKLNTEGLRLDTEAMKKELGGSSSASSVKLDTYGGLTETDNGLGVNIGTSGQHSILTCEDVGLSVDSSALDNHIAQFLIDGVTLKKYYNHLTGSNKIGVNVGTNKEDQYYGYLNFGIDGLFVDTAALFPVIVNSVADGTTLGTKATDDAASRESYRLTVKLHPDRCIYATGNGLGIKFKSMSPVETHLGTDGGLYVDTGTLFAEIASYFGLTPKT